MVNIKNILSTLLLFICLSFSVSAYDFQDESLNDKLNKNPQSKKDIKSNDIKSYMISTYTNTTQFETINELKSNRHLIKNGSYENIPKGLKDKLQIKKERTQIGDIYHNSLGAVKGRNLLNSDVLIDKGVVAVDNYNKLANDKFQVVMFTGDSNVKHALYKHPDFTNNKNKVLSEGSYYGEYYSKDGYITFNTSSFSTFVNTIPNEVLEGNEFKTISINSYVDTYDATFMEWSDDTGSSGRELGMQTGGIESDTYTSSSYSVTGDVTAQGAHTYEFQCNDANELITAQVEAWEQSDPSGTLDTSNTFTIECQELTEPPTQDFSISDVTLTGSDQEILSMNNYYSDYTTIEVLFNEAQASRSLITTIGQGTDSYLGNDLAVVLDAFNDDIELVIIGQDVNYNDDFQVRACNGDGCTSYQSFNVDVEESTTQTPSQTTSFGDVTLTGFESESLQLNDYFSNYDEVTLTFDGDASTQTLTRGKAQSTVQYNGNDIQVELNPSSNDIELNIYSQDVAYSETFTIEASNNDGSVSDTFTVTTSEGSSTPPPSGDDPILYYTMDDNDISGSTITDIVGTNDGTNNGATCGVTGIINEACDFDGSNDYMDLENIGSYNDYITFSAWVKYTDSNNVMMLANEKSGDSIFRIYLNNNQDLQVLQRSNNLNNRLDASISNSDIYDGTWNHIVITSDFSNQEINFYLNGVEQTTNYLNQQNTVSLPNLNLYLGADESNTRRYFKGDIDEVSIWDKALTQQEIEDLYNSGNGVQYPFESEPQQFTNFQNEYTISGTDTLNLNFNNFYSDYSDVTVTFDADESSQSLTASTNGSTQTYTGSDIGVELDTTTTDQIKLKVTGNNQVYSETFTLSVCNSQGCATDDTFTISTTESQTSLPNQLSSFAGQTITGSDEFIFDLNNFFSGFTSIEVVFSDPTTQSTQTISLDTTDSAEDTVFNNGLFEIRLVTLLSENSLVFENLNEDWTSDVTVNAINQYGSTSSNTFTMNGVSNGTNGGGGSGPTITPDSPDWFPEPTDSEHKPFWAMAVIFLFLIGIAFISINNEGNSTGLMYFGIVGVLALWLGFTYLGWLPLWILVSALIIGGLIIGGLITRTVVGR